MRSACLPVIIRCSHVHVVCTPPGGLSFDCSPAPFCASGLESLQPATGMERGSCWLEHLHDLHSGYVVHVKAVANQRCSEIGKSGQGALLGRFMDPSPPCPALCFLCRPTTGRRPVDFIVPSVVGDRKAKDWQIQVATFPYRCLHSLARRPLPPLVVAGMLALVYPFVFLSDARWARYEGRVERASVCRGPWSQWHRVWDFCDHQHSATGPWP